jgi:HAD superfamily phosphatase (TIGR01668 family)
MSEFRSGSYRKEQMPRALRRFCPDRSYASLIDIDVAELAASGKRLILLDVDNTLLPWRSESIPAATDEWVREAKRMGLELCILSNTRHPARLERIAKRLEVPFLRGRFKPSPSMYRQALAQFGVAPEQSVMIGDQIFTDVWGANRSGIEAIWVRPMTPRDFIGTKVSRLGERLIRAKLDSSMGAEDDPADAIGGSRALELLGVPVVRQFVKFAIVGGSSFAIDVGLHGLLMFVIPFGSVPVGTALGEWLLDTYPGVFSYAEAPSDAAFPVLKVLSVSAAILNSFYWNRLWTFKIRGKEERLTQLRRFVIVSVIGMGLNTLITTGLNNIIAGHPVRSWAVASAIATVIVAFWNFGGQKLWAFKQRHP